MHFRRVDIYGLVYVFTFFSAVVIAVGGSNYKVLYLVAAAQTFRLALTYFFPAVWAFHIASDNLQVANNFKIRLSVECKRLMYFARFVDIVAKEKFTFVLAALDGNGAAGAVCIQRHGRGFVRACFEVFYKRRSSRINTEIVYGASVRLRLLADCRFVYLHVQNFARNVFDETADKLYRLFVASYRFVYVM